MAAQYIDHVRNGTPFDKTRSLALTSFGVLYYGGFVVRLYRAYDYVLGPKNVVAKALFDVSVHTPFVVIPAFYAWTHHIEGRQDSLPDRLKNDWWTTSTASIAYWFPVQMMCFGFVPMVHRIAFVSCASFVHKTALSFWAHREKDEDLIQRCPTCKDILPPAQDAEAGTTAAVPKSTATNISKSPGVAGVPEAEPYIDEVQGGAVEENLEVPDINENQGVPAESKKEHTLGEKIVGMSILPNGIFKRSSFF
jgi:hypothetical protein